MFSTIALIAFLLFVFASLAGFVTVTGAPTRSESAALRSAAAFFAFALAFTSLAGFVVFDAFTFVVFVFISFVLSSSSY